MFDARVGDEVVFGAGFIRGIGEAERLVGDHAEVGDDGVGFDGDLFGSGAGFGWRGIGVSAAADEEECFFVGQFFGLGDGEPVFPDGLVDVGCRAPGLGCEFQNVGSVGVCFGFVDELPCVDIVFLGDVAVEGSLLSAAG